VSYNPLVPKWSPLAVTLVVALLVALGYFSYQAAHAYLRWQAIRYFTAEAFDPWPPDPERLDRLVPEIRQKAGKYGGNTLRLICMDLLMLHSWYRPETSVNELREALKVGQDLYRNGEVEPHRMLRQLSYAYTAACLPAKLERWQAEVQARAPQLRHYIRFYQVYGRIISDEPGGARELIESEVAAFGQDYPTSALALSGYLLLDDLDSAAMFAPLVEAHRRATACFSSITRCFAAARNSRPRSSSTALMTDSPADPDDALAQAVLLAALYGLSDPEVVALLQNATRSTRNLASLAAVEAMVAYRCTRSQTPAIGGPDRRIARVGARRLPGCHGQRLCLSPRRRERGPLAPDDGRQIRHRPTRLLRRQRNLLPPGIGRGARGQSTGPTERAAAILPVTGDRMRISHSPTPGRPRPAG
jgi:hypothetical protein